jgi:polar amino acid transport system permease protein
MQVVIDNFGLLLRGLRITLSLSALIIVFGTLLGLLGGIGSLYGPRWLRAALRVYVDIARGTPLLVQLFLIFYGLPVVGIDIDGYQAVVVGLSLFAAAHISEIVRGAVGSVPNGQWDAARGLGLTFVPIMRWVILPQAIPAALPPWTNTAIEMVKGTSLAYLLSVSDLLFSTQNVVERTGDAMPLYIAAALLYFVVNFGISRLVLWLEQRLRYAT